MISSHGCDDASDGWSGCDTRDPGDSAGGCKADSDSCHDANAFEEDARQCLAAGMNVHLAKPLQMDKVVAALMECCGKKRDL